MKIALRLDTIERFYNRATASRGNSDAAYENRFCAIVLHSIIHSGLVDLKADTLQWDDDAVLRLAEEIRAKRAAATNAAFDGEKATP
jgi:hypothetical protein